MTAPQPHLYHWTWVPPTALDAAQDVAWGLLIATLLAYVPAARAWLRDAATRRRAAVIGGVALALRLVVPFAPLSWYACANNVDLGGPMLQRDTSYMPLPNQVATFVFGFSGIVAFNIVFGALSAVLGWGLARRAGYGERVAYVFGLAIAVTPVYVRLSASDYTTAVTLPLWLVAAFALHRLVRGDGGRVDRIVAFLVAFVACPIRIETAAAMPAALIFGVRGVGDLRQVARSWRRWLPFVPGLLAGSLCNVATHPASWAEMLGRFSVLVFVGEILAAAAFLVTIDPFGWIPLFYVALIWFYLYTTWRRGDREELASTVLPFTVFSIPFAYSWKGMALVATILPAATYATCLYVFLLLAAAKGAVRLESYWRRSTWSREPLRRRAVVAFAALGVVGSLAVPYRTTYAYMEEFRFLRRSLPRDPAHLLTIFDSTSVGGDYDCCLALAYPTFVGDFPALQWQVLGQGDVDPARLRDLQFDYYYPGSLVQVDVDHLNGWFIGRLLGVDSESTARQQAPLRALQSIDAFIRRNYALVPYRSETLPARTFSWAPFPDDRMTLTIYRRVDGRASDAAAVAR